MSDQGYGGSGQGGPPEWNQQPNYGGQPGGGQYGGQPGGGQYGGQPGGDQYGQPTYGQPQYGDQGQYGNQGYGNQGQYGQPGFGGPGGPGMPPKNSGQKGIFIGLGAVVLAGLIVLVLAVTGVFSGDDSSGTSDTPKAALDTVLTASKEQNLDDVKNNVCKKDNADPDLADIVGDEHATDYKIGTVTQQGDERAVIDVKITTTKDSEDVKVNVVKEEGKWKVCFSDNSDITDNSSASASIPTYSTPTYTPGPTYSPPSTSSSSSLGNFCASSVSAASTARLFISFVTLKSNSEAAGCIYQNRVSTSEISSVIGEGKTYYPTIEGGQTGPTFAFTSVNGQHKLVITVERESDGKYYVTDIDGS